MSEKSAATQTALERSFPQNSTRAFVPVRAIGVNDLAKRLTKVYDEIASRAFSIFENDGRILGRDLENWLKAETELFHPVHANVVEANGTVTVKAEVPGFQANDLEIRLEPQRLIVSGKRETKEETQQDKCVRTEQCSNEIFRVVPLPAEVDASKAIATLKDGVLELQAPKRAEDKRVQVDAKVA